VALPKGRKCPFECNGHVTAVAVGKTNGFILVSEFLPGFISVPPGDKFIGEGPIYVLG
jgi:hypothetical protein